MVAIDTLDSIRSLAHEELLYDTIIYCEIDDLFTQDDTCEEIMQVINICLEVYYKKDYATLIGVAQSARDYIKDIRRKQFKLSTFDYDTLYSYYHGVGEWY